jgi:hypothetical protein
VVPPSSDRITRVPPYSRTHGALRIRGCHPLRPAFPDRSACTPPATGLLRFRSPLLAESLLMSVPPGTEMFQFPGFAPPAYGFSGRYPSRGGLPHSDIHGSTPARGSPWLFAACHVLHRLLVPRHPPNALLALEIIRTRPEKSGPARHHAQEPSPAQREGHAAAAPIWCSLSTYTHRAPDPASHGRPCRHTPGKTPRRRSRPPVRQAAARPRDAPNPDSP